MAWIDIYTKSESKIRQPQPQSIKGKIPPPFGFDESLYKEGKSSSHRSNRPSTVRNFDLEKLRKKKAWELAFSPAKNIPMNLIMMYFSPNNLQLIPIMMTLMLFVNPIKDILSVGSKFDPIELDDDGVDKIVMKFVYCVCSLGTIVVGIWKLNSMGLIPNSSSDWLAWENPILSSYNTSFI